MVKASQGSPFYSQPYDPEASEARRRAALRDEFACQILPFCASIGLQYLNGHNAVHNAPLAAVMAYAYADAMLQAREAK